MSEIEFETDFNEPSEVEAVTVEPNSEYQQVDLDDSKRYARLGATRRSVFLDKVYGLPLAPAHSIPFSFFERALTEEVEATIAPEELLKEQKRAISILSAAMRNRQAALTAKGDERFYTTRSVVENGVVGMRVIRLHPDNAPAPVKRGPRE